MYKGKKIVALIPARRGSKRIKEKNGVLINGKPLFEYSIKVAKESKYVDEVIFSTDSQDWLNYAQNLGCEKNKLRPKELSGDASKTIDVILYELGCMECKDFDAIVLLQPTSPYRTVDLLDGAIEEYFKTETSLVTIISAKEQPIFIRKIVNGKLEKILTTTSDVRSQDFEKIYKIIGNIYINNVKELKYSTVLNENEVGYIIDEKFDIDIDTIEDFEKARAIIEESKC